MLHLLFILSSFGVAFGQDRIVYKVDSVVNPPYLNAADANSKNSGFIIDVLEAIKGVDSAFDYHLTQRADGLYGDVLPYGVTTGIVNGLITGAADIGAIDFTITKSRVAVLDFTVPFLRSQYRILTNKYYNAANTTYFTFRPDLTVPLTNFLQKAAKLNNTIAAIYATIQAFQPKPTSYQEAVQILITSTASLALVAEYPNLCTLHNAYQATTTLLPDGIGTSYYALAVKSGSALLKQLNNDLLTIEENGTLQQITNRYFFGC